MQKVYGILMCQLLVTVGIMAIFMFVKPIRDWVWTNQWVVFTSIGGASAVMLGCVIALACVPGLSRKSPGNLVCLAIFTGEG